MTVWSGGYDSPQIKLHYTELDAEETVREWAPDMDEGDIISIYELDIAKLECILRDSITIDDVDE